LIEIVPTSSSDSSQDSDTSSKALMAKDGWSCKTKSCHNSKKAKCEYEEEEDDYEEEFEEEFEEWEECYEKLRVYSSSHSHSFLPEDEEYECKRSQPKFGHRYKSTSNDMEEEEESKCKSHKCSKCHYKEEEVECKNQCECPHCEEYTHEEEEEEELEFCFEEEEEEEFEEFCFEEE